MSKETQQKPDLKEMQKDGKEASEQMQQSREELSKDQNSKASQSQNKAAQNLQKMSESMRAMAGGMNAQQIEIDIKATRQLLTNLMRLSFDQEQLMKKVQTTSAASGNYLVNQKEQNRLHSNSRMVRDSLYVLSKRIFQLAPTVNKETTELEKNMGAASEGIEGRRIGDVVTRQQYVMTHTNNLALMLNELLSNLMSQQSQAQGAAGQCSNPGGQKPKDGAGSQLGDVITQQKKLGDAMQQVKDAMQRRQQGQDGQDGEGGKSDKSQEGGNGGEYGDAEQLAKMAEQQATLRRQLQEINRMLNSQGIGSPKELQEIQQQMDRNETDLVNKRMSGELLLRQKEILTRLLEAEKSLREQQEDDKRSSKSAEDISKNMPAELQKYMKDRQQLLDLYKTVPPQLKPYYKAMVQQYYQLIGTK